MDIEFTLPSLIKISLYWHGRLSIGTQGNIYLFSSDKTDIERAKNLENILSNYLTFEFYTEDEKHKIKIQWKKEIIITINKI